MCKWSLLGGNPPHHYKHHPDHPKQQTNEYGVKKVLSAMQIKTPCMSVSKCSGPLKNPEVGKKGIHCTINDSTYNLSQIRIFNLENNPPKAQSHKFQASPGCGTALPCVGGHIKTQ